MVIERREYEPYGRQLTPTPVEDGPGYTGHVSDAATGLDYMQQRYYDPQVGRFLSVDPVTTDLKSGSNYNRYSYANSNPYGFSDPDGRQARKHDRRSLNSHSSNRGGVGSVGNVEMAKSSGPGTAGPSANLTDEQVKNLANRTKGSLQSGKELAAQKLDSYCATSPSDCNGVSSNDLANASIRWADTAFYGNEDKSSLAFTGEYIDRSTSPPTIVLFKGGIALGFGPGRVGVANVLTHALRHISPGGTALSLQSAGKSYGVRPAEIDAFGFQRRVMGEDYYGP